MSLNRFPAILLLVASSSVMHLSISVAADLPNIVFILADDLGYGDVKAFGGDKCNVDTPHFDQMCAEGMKFTDAHVTDSVCVPSRTSIMTGRYAFRFGKAERGGPWGFTGLRFPESQHTIGDMFRSGGYATGYVGKWHLGLGNGDLDWNGSISPGPRDIGFDYSFLLPATGDRVPTVYVENRAVVDLDAADPIEVSYQGKVGVRPTGYENPDLLRYGADPQHSDTIVNGVSRIGHLGGGESALWVDEDFPDIFTAKAIQFIRDHENGPFFLFHSFHDIHVPRLPNRRFEGRSSMGPRGDAIVQMDWMVGEVINELEALDLIENTLVIFTSDNGPVLDDGYADQSVDLIGNHQPSGPFRGGKYSAYEGGTRVPTVVYWPGTLAASINDALLSQIDVYASIAGLVGVELDVSEAIDSRNQLDAWLGRTGDGREYLVEESVGTLSLRRGNWKYIRPFAGGSRYAWVADDKSIEGGFELHPQLYNLSSDMKEQINLAAVNPELAAAMHAELERIVKNTY